MKLIYSRYMHFDLIYKFVPEVKSIWTSSEYSGEECLDWYDGPLAGIVLNDKNEKLYYHLHDRIWVSGCRRKCFDTFLLFKYSDKILDRNQIVFGEEIVAWFCDF